MHKEKITKQRHVCLFFIWLLASQKLSVLVGLKPLWAPSPALSSSTRFHHPLRAPPLRMTMARRSGHTGQQDHGISMIQISTTKAVLGIINWRKPSVGLHPFRSSGIRGIRRPSGSIFGSGTGRPGGSHEAFWSGRMARSDRPQAPAGAAVTALGPQEKKHPPSVDLQHDLPHERILSPVLRGTHETLR